MSWPQFQACIFLDYKIAYYQCRHDEYSKCSKILNTTKNRADPDQTASEEEAVWSGSPLFAILTSILRIPALKTKILFENKKRKVFKTLED